MKPFRYQQELVLRPRIKQILLLLAKGYKESDIAFRLGISLSTVYSYMTDIRQQYKLGETPAEMVITAVERGLLSETEMP